MTIKQAIATITQEFHIGLTLTARQRLHQILRECIHSAAIQAGKIEAEAWADKKAKILAILYEENDYS